jgi:uncharacterized protein (UPF0248 family)
MRSAVDKFMCHGKKERRRIVIIIRRRRNGAKTISLQTLFVPDGGYYVPDGGYYRTLRVHSIRYQGFCSNFWLMRSEIC